MNALEIKNLTKHYKSFTLKDLSLTLPGGCIMGLVGENGAGKSTTIKLILDIIKSDSGAVTVLGRDNRTQSHLIKEDIGVVFDEPGFPLCMNAAQIGKAFLSGRLRDGKETEAARMGEIQVCQRDAHIDPVHVQRR